MHAHKQSSLVDASLNHELLELPCLNSGIMRWLLKEHQTVREAGQQIQRGVIPFLGWDRGVVVHYWRIFCMMSFKLIQRVKGNSR